MARHGPTGGCSGLRRLRAGRASGDPAALGAGAARAPAPPRGQVLNIYNWSDYIAPASCPPSRREYGIKVNYDVFDSNEVLRDEAPDAAIPATTSSCPRPTSWQQQIKAGVFQKLDKSLLPEPQERRPGGSRAADPRSRAIEHSVNYLWGTSGIGYNVDKIRAAMPDAPVDSLAMLFDPAVVSRFKDCGVTILDEPPRSSAPCCCTSAATRQREARGSRGGRAGTDGDPPQHPLRPGRAVPR